MKKGISLVALVITIIVLVVLAATVAFIVGENGIIQRAKTANENSQLAQYREMIQIIINDSKIKLLTQDTGENFLIYNKNELQKESWVKEVISMDENYDSESSVNTHCYLKVVTKENYEILLSINEEKNNINILDLSGSSKEQIILSYDLNGGDGNLSNVTVKQGWNVKIASGEGITKNRYIFIGWNTKPDGSGITYSDRASITLTEDVTLYAIWE